MVPATLAECFQALNKELGPEGQFKLQGVTRDDLVTQHHSLGRWIRNNWELWKDGPLAIHMKGLGFTHPDDMSSSIIKEYWLILNGLPSELEKDKAEYKAYWDKVEKDSNET